MGSICCLRNRRGYLLLTHHPERSLPFRCILRRRNGIRYRSICSFAPWVKFRKRLNSTDKKSSAPSCTLDGLDWSEETWNCETLGSIRPMNLLRLSSNEKQLTMWLGAASLFFAVFLKITSELFENEVQGLDTSLLMAVARMRSPWLSNAAMDITALGSVALVTVITV